MTIEYSTIMWLVSSKLARTNQTCSSSQKIPFPPTLLKEKILCLWDRGDGLRCKDVLKCDALSLHLNSVHGCRGQDDTLLTCWWDGCGKHMEKCAIASHIRDVHIGVTYPCRRCGITFGGKSSFQLHLPECSIQKE